LLPTLGDGYHEVTGSKRRPSDEDRTVATQFQFRIQEPDIAPGKAHRNGGSVVADGTDPDSDPEGFPDIEGQDRFGPDGDLRGSGAQGSVTVETERRRLKPSGKILEFGRYSSGFFRGGEDIDHDGEILGRRGPG